MWFVGAGSVSILINTVSVVSAEADVVLENDVEGIVLEAVALIHGVVVDCVIVDGVLGMVSHFTVSFSTALVLLTLVIS